ncbi:hypothetical protein [Aminobacter sp. J44]|uniref:hypothetical protein n=1 Tax=Aminobacter sp. J44 TaxID=935262 RepID=UPI00119B4D80|nr:hypothetical protein [Aminobacter sp. J44]TWG49649.1 hypothetical protein L610_000700000950 [Aminobacter sp. J44]
MSNLNKVLEQLHTELAETLLAKIRSGEATASDLSVARQFLKDNGIDGARKPNSPIDNLAKEIPFTEIDDLDERAGYLPN